MNKELGVENKGMIDEEKSLILKRQNNNVFALGVFQLDKKEKVQKIRINLEYLRQSLELLKSVSDEDVVDIKMGKNIPLFIGKGNAGIIIAPASDLEEENWG